MELDEEMAAERCLDVPSLCSPRRYPNQGKHMNHFVSKDLYICSYLYSANCKLLSHARADGITMFAFERTKELERLLEAYFSMTPSVNPLKYDQAMRTLRALAMGPKSHHENTLSSRVAA